MFRTQIASSDLSPIDGIFGLENREQITFDKDQALASSRTLNAFRMPAGDHTFLFDILLPSKIFETVTGPKHQYHTYRVEAVVERLLKADFVVSQPIRIYQIPDFESSYLRPYLPLTVEGHSSQDIRYYISIIDRNVPFGCTFPVECWFSPLSKHTKLNTVTIKVVENHAVRLEATASELMRHNIHFLTSAQNHTIFSKTINFDSGDESTLNEFSENEWRFHTQVCLPQDLDACSQSISTKHIKITHEAVVAAEFRDDAGGLTVEIKESMPFKIHMTPNVIGMDTSILGQEIRLVQGNWGPPPAYSEHFSDIVLPVTADRDLREHPMLGEIDSWRSSSEQIAGMHTMGTSPRYDI
ncbi:hypothetical protein N7485_000005 [Penicillium canescens]|nr:hypothetical protein N7485_000005 [Penicillium canescens]